MADEWVLYRANGNVVELAGKYEAANEPPVASLLPEGYRPYAEMRFRVEGERGPAMVTVTPDGGILADTDSGWVILDGIRFAAAT